MDNRSILLHLSLIKGIGPKVIFSLLRTMGNIPFVELYGYTTDDFMHKYGISERSASSIVAGLKDKHLLANEQSLLEKHHISIVTILDDNYPLLLKEIYLPPIILYLKGNISLLHQQSIAIVGARKANWYGRAIVSTLVPDLVRHGLTIVSGGAIGIDSYAHQETLKVQGNTIVVLGSGLLNIYPMSNKTLFNQVENQHGLLLSSFPLTTEPLKGNFPARNRIIAGLSLGCMVIQAAKKSGACITASFALEQGREVYAAPGLFNDSLSEGCHNLIKEGATLVTSSYDILASLRPYLVSIDNMVVAAATHEDNLLLRLCNEPITLDELQQQSEIPLEQLQSLLFDLQLENKVMQNHAGLWQIIA